MMVYSCLSVVSNNDSPGGHGDMVHIVIMSPLNHRLASSQPKCCMFEEKVWPEWLPIVEAVVGCTRAPHSLANVRW